MTKREEGALIERYTRESGSGIVTLSMHGVEELVAELDRLRDVAFQVERGEQC